MLHYTRRKKINPNDENVTADFIDDCGDKWSEFTVYHHKFKEWMDTTDPDCDWEVDDPSIAVSHSPYAYATANEIDWRSKVSMQAAAQKWICHAISNTTNLPSDIDVETVKDIYMMGWETGCKGITVYRDGCRSGVLVSKNCKDKEKSREEIEFADRSAPKRPSELICEIHHVQVKGEKWTVLIGLMSGRPYEVIGGLSKYVEVPRKHGFGTITRRPRKTIDSKYDLACGEGDDKFLVKDVVAVFDNPNHSGYTRAISMVLRHGAPIQYVVEQLQKDKDADLWSFSKVIARCLKKYIKDGCVGGDKVCPECSTENSLVYQEGCITCKSCGWGKCG